MIDLGFADKTVVVTGAASHIGRSIAHKFAGQQARVVIVDIDSAKGEETCREALELGATDGAFVQADLSTAKGCSGAIQAARTAFGDDRGIDVLVNNFGWGEPGSFLEGTDEYWDRLWRLNLACTMACSQAALVDMKTRQRGSIVSIASAAAAGFAGPFSVYGALKAGIVNISRSIAQEFGRYNIRSNVIAPGIILPEDESTGSESVWMRHDPLTEKQIEQGFARSALRRGGKGEDIANAVLFLSSDIMARQVTGQLISVCGGSWMP